MKDRVTGFSGIATTVADHLTGCRRYWIEGPDNEKGEATGRWVDEARIEVLVADEIVVEAEEVAARPAPSDCDPPRRGGPARP